MEDQWKNRSLESNISFIKDTCIISLLCFLFFILRHKIIFKIAEKKLNRSDLSKKDKKKIQQKFLGSAYRWVIYTIFFIYGLITLRNENWLFKPFLYTLTWEKNETPCKIFLYYYIELSHYLASIIFLFCEPRMSDFYQMLAHHIITILLIVLSFHRNLLRYGVSIMILHDIADPFMESAKLLFYLKKQKLADRMFVIFALIFITSRCLIYPMMIIIPAFSFAFMYGMNPEFAIQLFALVFLFLLNSIWSYFIVKMIRKFASSGSVKGDIRTEDGVSTKNNN